MNTKERPDLSSEKLIAIAQQQTGLSDLGGDEYKKSYQLIRSSRTSGGLS